ncbi:hypothetical protein SAMN05446935_9930 [Burkholderia sp. YR290]|nr:hypothetical protein SAMN05446935_9930 [Burkholderia sp. YR290]
MNWDTLTLRYKAEREKAANAANAEDADVWRWFCALFEEGRLRWCRSPNGWLVSIDHKHLSTEDSFDEAIRVARDRLEVGVRHSRRAKNAVQ